MNNKLTLEVWADIQAPAVPDYKHFHCDSPTLTSSLLTNRIIFIFCKNVFLQHSFLVILNSLEIALVRRSINIIRIDQSIWLSPSKTSLPTNPHVKEIMEGWELQSFFLARWVFCQNLDWLESAWWKETLQKIIISNYKKNDLKEYKLSCCVQVKIKLSENKIFRRTLFTKSFWVEPSLHFCKSVVKFYEIMEGILLSHSLHCLNAWEYWVKVKEKSFFR